MKTIVSLLLSLVFLVQPAPAAVVTNLLQLPGETFDRENRTSFFNFSVPAFPGSPAPNASITLTLSITATTTDINHFGPTLPSSPFLRLSVAGYMIRDGTLLAEKFTVVSATAPVMQLQVGRSNVFQHTFSQTLTVPLKPFHLAAPARFMIVGSLTGSGSQTAIIDGSATAKLSRN